MTVQLEDLREYLSPDLAAQLESARHRFNIADGERSLFDLVKALHREGENLLALESYRVIVEVCEHYDVTPSWRDELELMYARILHTTCSYHEAIDVLTSLHERVGSDLDVEVLGNLASVYKSLALEHCDEQASYFAKAFDTYAQVFKRPELAGNYWLGVNALMLATLQGQTTFVEQHLTPMMTACQVDVASDEENFWAQATLAELTLIGFIHHGGETNTVVAAYQRANQYCQSASERKSARKNLPLLFEKLNTTQGYILRERIDMALPAFKVACFTGHRVDEPGRPEPRFPSSCKQMVYKALQHIIDDESIRVGYCSLSNGGDLLFAQAMLQSDATVHGILPFDALQFLAESVQSHASDDRDWQSLYMSMLEDTSGHLYLNYAGRGVIDPADAAIYYEHANQVIYGLASLRAKELSAELMPVAVLHQGAWGSAVGSAHAVDVWRQRGHNILVIDPLTLEKAQLAPLEMQASPPEPEGEVVLRTMLFADLRGFSQFDDMQIQAFCQRFLPLVDALLNDLHRPLELNTWGDGLFMVFADCQQATEVALSLAELMATPAVEAVWRQFRMHIKPAMRISMHSAPVRKMQNPLTGQITHWGTNINIAARIEPITPINQVYASVATAALLEYAGAQQYRADFVGVVPLAKQFRAQEIFRIRRV